MLAAPAYAESTTLTRVENYLTDMKTIVADFTQIAPDGTLASGKFFLKRPKQMRWQYAPPTPILMVTRGNYLTYYDYELDQVSDIPLDDTLLGFLSKKEISFSDEMVEITEVTSIDEEVRISLIKKDAPEEGKLVLEFSDSPLKLENFIITDTTGQTTTVSLQNSRFNIDLDDEVFDFRDPRIGGRKKR
jgi:outer membrane lipoprotein-sorting protein